MQKLFDMINFFPTREKIIKIYTRRGLNTDELTSTKRE